VLTLALFAPRNPDGLGLWSSLADPATFPALVEAGLVAPLAEYGRVWLSSNGNDALTYAVPLGKTLAVTAVTVVVAGGLGFVANRYGDRDEVVAFALVWAGLSAFAYPIAALVNAPWHAVHVVVPLAIPGAVAIAAVARRVVEGVRDAEPGVAGVAVLVLCVALGAPLATAAGTAYLHPQSQDNPLVQYGQPSDDFRDTLAAIDAGAAANDDGPDVVYYGAYFHVENPERTNRLPVGDVYVQDDGEYRIVEQNEGWYNRLPLPWYTESFGATTASADSRDGLDALAATDPPVVVTRSQHADVVAAELADGYRRTTFNLTQHNVTVTVFVDDTAVAPRPEIGPTGHSLVDAEPAVAPAVARDRSRKR